MSKQVTAEGPGPERQLAGRVPKDAPAGNTSEITVVSRLPGIPTPGAAVLADMLSGP